MKRKGTQGYALSLKVDFEEDQEAQGQALYKGLKEEEQIDPQ